jgi:hypothetical protein
LAGFGVDGPPPPPPPPLPPLPPPRAKKLRMSDI